MFLHYSFLIRNQLRLDEAHVLGETDKLSRVHHRTRAERITEATSDIGPHCVQIADALVMPLEYGI